MALRFFMRRSLQKKAEIKIFCLTIKALYASI